MNPNAAALDGTLKRLWTPVLKADGYRITGRTARRIRGGWIQVVQVQMAREGDAFAVNLGLQPEGLPDGLGQIPDPGRILESVCVFRRRLSESGDDRWWDLADGPENAVTSMVGEYARWAAPWLAKVGGEECPFRRATVADLEQGGGILAGFDFVPAKHALNLARLRLAAGQMSEARAFARFGLVHLGRATLLQEELESLCHAGEAPT